MKTIKIKTTESKEIEIEREIQVPAFFKKESGIYKIESEEKATAVHVWKDAAQIDTAVLKYKIKELVGNGEAVTEEAFNAHLEKALSFFSTITPQTA